LLDPKLFGVKCLTLTFLETIEDLAILRCTQKYFAGSIDGLQASSHMPIRCRDLACEEIEMCVREPQTLGIELTMLDDELTCQRFATAAKHFATRFGVGEHALLASQEQLLLIFDAFALP
jgi:hypothetical protein